MKKRSETASIKHLLENQREELLRRVEITHEDREPVELDQSQVGRLSRMDAMQIQEMALEQERRRGIEIQRINAALARITDGEYGFCLKCGESILSKRLEFDPSTPLCVDCASGQELSFVR
jgi:DnaK suppressor protein